MSTITCEDQIAQFQQFRQDIYANFPNNRDSLMDLLDALSGNTTAQTPESTWHQSDETVQTNFTTRRGRQVQLNISAWHQMLMRGTKEYPMHQHPFTLLQVRVTDEFSQQLWHPMWLIVLGQRRNELTIMDCYLSYRQRFDMEHTLRLGKQRLLMNSFQTPDVEHEENWVQLSQLAYIQLWAARDLVSVLPRPKRKILS